MVSSFIFKKNSVCLNFQFSYLLTLTEIQYQIYFKNLMGLNTYTYKKERHEKKNYKVTKKPIFFFNSTFRG